MDPATGEYNRPLLTDTLTLVPGYGRMQGFAFRREDARFEGKSLDQAIRTGLSGADCVMVNRNAGSGTRIIIDRVLGDRRPAGYGTQTKSHNAVAVAVSQKRADWGIAIDTVARQYGLGFIPIQEEQYDFIVPTARLERPAVRAFRNLLNDADVREELRTLGFRVQARHIGP
jgi:putative molybdopterin biosynthesis protein